MLERVWRKGNSSALLAEIKVGAATVEKKKGKKKEKKRKQSSGQNKVIFLKNQTNTKLVMSNVSN